MDGKEVRENLRNAISEYCRWRVNNNWCDDGQCEYCAVNQTYDMARDPDAFEDFSADE